MIEPQNTMLPIAAESATVDVPNGEGGFGEMLAQTLGIATVDPNAILGLSEQAQGEESEEGAGFFAEDNATETDDRLPLTRYIGVPANGEIVVAKPVDMARPPVDDTIVTEPVFADSETPEIPVAAVPLPEGDDRGIVDPVLADVGDLAPDVDPPLLEAVPTDEVSVFQPQPTPDPMDRVAPPEISEPAPTMPGSPDEPVVAPAPSDVRTPSSPIAAVAAQPVVADDSVKPPTPERGMPTTPIPSAAVSTTVSTEADVAQDVIAPNRVSLQDTDVKLPATPIQITDSTVPVESRPASVSVPAVAIEGLQSPVTPVTEPTIPAAPTQHSALAERVLQAVELQANQPPPRTMVVDIPEIEGLRLVVSVRSGAEVHVVQASNSAAGDGFQPFMDELQGVLEGRGFMMTGDGRRRGNSRYQDESEQRPQPRRLRTFNRPSDGYLRI